jgi:predicted RNase H-like nuclease (RuvC/YqgF family)
LCVCFIYFFPFKEQAKEPVNAELHQQHLRSEYKDEIQELKNQISFLNEQIRDSTYELEIERDHYNNKIAEKDAIILNLQEEIKSLKELNPEALAKSQFSLKISIFKFYLNYFYILLGLNEGLALLHTTLETLTISQVTAQQSRYQLERSESGRTNLVKLHKDYETTVHQNALATAISYTVMPASFFSRQIAIYVLILI